MPGPEPEQPGSDEVVCQIQAIGDAPESLLRRESDVQEKDCCFKAGISFLDPLATDDHAGQIFANWAVVGSGRMCANAYGQLCPEGKMPARSQHDAPLSDVQVSIVPKATIDPVVEINREVRALGIT
jgi:hypothetical protein